MKKFSPGFTLVEVLVTVSLFSLLVLGVAQYFSKRLTEQKVLMLNAAKGRVIKQVELAVNDPMQIKNSIEVQTGTYGVQNKAFLDCLMSPATCPARYFDGTRPQPMDFMIADDQGGYIPMTGFWSREGASGCLPPRPDTCPMQAKVSFWFTCARDRSTGLSSATCQEIAAVNLIFQMAPTSAKSEDNAGVNFFHPTVDGQIPNPENFAISIPSKKLMELFSQTCLSYHFVDGYRGDGTMICKCLNHRPQKNSDGTPRLDALGRPLCESNQCQQDEILLGFEQKSNNEWAPVCLGTNMKKHCYKINLKDTPECADNYWISHIEYGKCDLIDQTSKKKAYTKQDVTCANDSALCCREYE
jgi:prepilin-type N-terminal cleavage/methylation domain-containing protein